MELHIRPDVKNGLTPVVKPGQELKHLGFSLIRLQAGESCSATLTGEEGCLVILSGNCDITGPGYSYTGLGTRNSVFAGPATSVYLPAGSAYTVKANTAVRIAVATSPAPAGGEPKLIGPDEVVVNLRGKPGFRREVQDILDRRTPARRLVLGETISFAGEWSSYPSHKHDQSIPGVEANMEELYYFEVDPGQGFGIQVLYTADSSLEKAYVLKTGDVTLLPYGYHPVAAAPGYRVYYLWAMAGEGRELLPTDDPAHAWVKNA